MERTRVADYVKPTTQTLRAWAMAGLIIWVVVGAGIVAWGAGHVIATLLSTLTAFLIAGLIVVLTRPFVRFMVKRGLGRGWAAAIASIAMLVIIVGVAAFFLGPIFTGAAGLLQSLASQGSTFSNDIAQAVGRFNALPDPIRTGIVNGIKTAGAAIAQIARSGLRILFGSTAMIASLGFSAFIALILTFWFLKDGPEIAGHMLNVVPAHWRDDAREVASAFNRSFSGYLIGTAINMTVIFLICGVGFQVVGLPFAWFLAALIGIMDVIPFVGPILSGIVAVLVGLTVSPTLALMTGVIVLAGQQFVDSFLSPIVMGKAVAIHPVAIIFALSIGIMLGGFLGAILAIPVAAAIKTVYLYFRDVRPAKTAPGAGSSAPGSADPVPAAE